jgi:proline iminopeptidase
MKATFAYIVISFCLLTNSHAQQIDSIKYEYGYLYYHHYGSGETIILLSGGPGNSCLQLEDVALKLSSKYRVILLEQRGTGLSIPKPFDSTTINLKASFDDINLVIDHLKLKEVILCAHSFGGSRAMFFAAAYPRK